MALTRLPKNAFATGSVDASKIEDGTIQAVEVSGTITQDKIATGTIANAKLSNSSITINGTSVTLGASASVGVDVNWQSVITADGSTATTGVAGNGYFIDTTSNVHTFNLPASATLGDQIAIKDYAGTFNTNNLTIGRNGHNIQGVANNSLITTNRASLLLVYVDSTKGWIYTEESNVADLQGPTFITATGGTITTSGDFKIHSFTGDGCFVVSTIGNPLSPATFRDKTDYLVVAGGGGGSWAGGGAGGYRTGSISGCTGITVTATTYPITIGGGGPGGATATAGSNSVFSTITSAGGGYGGSFSDASPQKTGGSGGSGGGGGGNLHATQGSAGSGNTPPVNPPQGNPGGKGSTDQSTFTNGGGGGGASQPGGGGNPNPDTSPSPSVGGDGNNTHIPYFGCAPQPFYPVPTGYFAGGGGGTNQSPGSLQAGGNGGGGRGTPGTATTGTTNSGGGGGNNLAGGSGIVIIRYKFQ